MYAACFLSMRKRSNGCCFLHFTGYNMTSESRDSPLTFHRVVEAFKFGFSWRSLLGDPAFNDAMNEVIAVQEKEITFKYCLTIFKGQNSLFPKKIHPSEQRQAQSLIYVYTLRYTCN